MATTDEADVMVEQVTNSRLDDPAKCQEDELPQPKLNSFIVDAGKVPRTTTDLQSAFLKYKKRKQVSTNIVDIGSRPCVHPNSSTCVVQVYKTYHAYKKRVYTHPVGVLWVRRIMLEYPL